MKVLVIFGWLALGATALPPSSRRMLLSVETTTKDQGDILKAAAESDFELDFWTQPTVKGSTDVLVPWARFEELNDLWTSAGMKVKVMHEDVDGLIRDVDEQNARIAQQNRATPSRTTLNHNYYRSYGTYEMDLVYLRNRFPSLIRFDETGQSLRREKSIEGRTIHFFEVGANPSNPVIMMEVNIHAREWITSSGTFYMADWLVTNYGLDHGATSLLDNFNLVIIPVANPDGYEYSRANERLWRKNRRRVSLFCNGVDLNRNFNAFWDSGTNCRSDTYPGATKDSEPETRAVESVFNYFKGNMIMYLAVHCYAQVLMLPWAYERSYSAVNNRHVYYALEMAEEMRSVAQRRYGVGTPFGTIGYNAKGSSADWALLQKEHEDKRFISIAYELRPESGHGFDGFVRNASEIIPAGEELLKSVQRAGEMLAAEP